MHPDHVNQNIFWSPFSLSIFPDITAVPQKNRELILLFFLIFFPYDYCKFFKAETVTPKQ